MVLGATTPRVLTGPKMQLKPILQPIATEMCAVDSLIRQRLSSDVVLINQLADYIINSGGKRLRPAVVLLAARASGYQGEKHLLLSAIIEFIHTATLLHDDVVDDSKMRRGNATANAIWGNGASVLTGDFLYSRAFQMTVDLERMSVMQILADATNRIAEGEVLQLMNCHSPDLSEAQYMQVTERKTASLFAAGCQLGAVICDAPEAQQEAMRRYGHHLGVAFQVVDDALDYGKDSTTIGKNIGDDLAEGKTTLPLIQAMQKGSPEQIASIRTAIETGGAEQLETVKQAIESTQAMAYTFARAEDEAQAAIKALSEIPDSEYKTALSQLAEFSVRRSF